MSYIVEKSFQVILLFMTLIQMANFDWLWVHSFIPPYCPSNVASKFEFISTHFTHNSMLFGKGGVGH